MNLKEKKKKKNLSSEKHVSLLWTWEEDKNLFLKIKKNNPTIENHFQLLKDGGIPEGFTLL